MLKLENNVYFFLEAFVLFLLINFNPSLAIVYLGMMLISAQVYFEDPKLEYPLRKPTTSHLSAIMWAAGTYIIFNFSSQIVFPLFDIQSKSFIDIMASTLPAFAGSTLLFIAAYGFMIPQVETVFFHVRAFEKLKEIAQKKGYNTSTLQIQIALAVIIMAGWVIFHITAKGVTANDSLIVTALFSLYSSALVIYFKEGLQAVYLHIINNTAAILRLQGYI